MLYIFMYQTQTKPFYFILKPCIFLRTKPNLSLFTSERDLHASVLHVQWRSAKKAPDSSYS